MNAVIYLQSSKVSYARHHEMPWIDMLQTDEEGKSLMHSQLVATSICSQRISAHALPHSAERHVCTVRHKPAH